MDYLWNSFLIVSMSHTVSEVSRVPALRYCTICTCTVLSEIRNRHGEWDDLF